jgi:hypothetical protein
MYQDVCDKIMLSAVHLVCDYQGKVDVEQSKMGRINFNAIFPSLICMLKDQKTQNSRS